MKYLRVHWIHSCPSEPVLLLSELDDQRYEVRKIEVFADGRMGYAFGDHACGGTLLGELPIPSASEIARDPQFVVEEIDKNVFEESWLQIKEKGSEQA